jgi:hypothetical protein
MPRYPVGDIMSGMEEVFALSYIENNCFIRLLTQWPIKRDDSLIKMAKTDNATSLQALKQRFDVSI